MNLLAHYYLDKEHISPYFKLGVIFPDIFPHYNQKLRKAVNSHNYLNPDHHNFVKGINRHHEVDKIFHNSPVFKHLNDTFKTIILDEDFPQLHFRTYYLAHILVELLIDKQLISQNNSLLDQFYSDLEDIDENTLHLYFINIDAVEKTSDFFFNFKRFRENRYLYYLNDNEKLVDALMRIYCRINPINLNKEEKGQLARVTRELESTYMVELGDALSYVKERLSYPC